MSAPQGVTILVWRTQHARWHWGKVSSKDGVAVASGSGHAWLNMGRFAIYVSTRLKSFRHAGAGIVRLLREEQNARIHALAATMVLVGAVWLRLSAVECAVLAIAVASVFGAEAANSAIERLADAVTIERNPLIGAAKDLGAACVLLASVGALIVGVLIFGARAFE